MGLVDQSYRGILELRGKDSTRFLNGMVTNDVKSLKAGSGQYAAMLSVHGKLIADMRIYAVADGYWLDLQEELVPKVLQTIDRHLIADQVEVRDRSADFVLLALQGPASAELLARLGIVGAKDLEEYQHLETAIEGRSVRVIRASETGEEGFVLAPEAGAAVAVWQGLLQAGRDDRLRPVGMEALNILRIEAGIPWYGIDMDETNLLQEAGLERAASFSKGCYIGQETVVRVAHRGHVNWHLVGLLIGSSEVPEVGAKLRHDAARGRADHQCGAFTRAEPAGRSGVCPSRADGAGNDPGTPGLAGGYLRRDRSDSLLQAKVMRAVSSGTR